MDIQKLTYPIGKRVTVSNPDQSLIEEWITDIETFPQRLEKLLQNATTAQLSYRYRPGGWTVKQVVHHCADSHLNGMAKFKLALTEDSPTIKPYIQEGWANTTEATSDDLTYSIQLLKGLHAKWIVLLRSLSSDEMQRGYIHPAHDRLFTIEESIQIYSWHCNHHFAHVENGLQSEGKYNL